MPWPQLVYSHPRENLLREATAVTVTDGATAEGYGVEKLSTGTWADPCMATGDSLTVLMEFPAPVLPAFAALLNSNLDVAATLEGHSSNSWGAPAVSAAFAVPTMDARGFFSSPILDLSAETAQAWWRLVIVGNTRDVILGGLHLGIRRVLDGYLFPGVGLSIGATTAVNRTYAGMPLNYELTPATHGAAGTLVVSGADRAAAVDLILAARGQARPFVIVPRSDVDEAWMVQVASDTPRRTPRAADTDEVELPLAMVSRGLPWVEPDDLPLIEEGS